MPRPAIRLSVSSTKADAARRLFNVNCKDLTWAVVDSGVDGTHPAFGDKKHPDAAAVLAATIDGQVWRTTRQSAPVLRRSRRPNPQDLRLHAAQAVDHARQPPQHRSVGSAPSEDFDVPIGG